MTKLVFLNRADRKERRRIKKKNAAIRARKKRMCLRIVGIKCFAAGSVPELAYYPMFVFLRFFNRLT